MRSSPLSGTVTLLHLEDMLVRRQRLEPGFWALITEANAARLVPWAGDAGQQRVRGGRAGGRGQPAATIG